MAIKTITLTKQTRTFHSLPVIEFGQGETLRFRLTDTDNDLNGATLFFSLREGLNNPFQSLVNQPELVSNTQRSLTVSGGFADFFVNYDETKNWGVGNKIYTLEIKIRLLNGYIFEWGKYETRISENLVNGLGTSSFSPSSYPLAFWYKISDFASLTFNGNKISQINDKSGNGRHLTQATSSKQATRYYNPITNKSGLIFDGVDDDYKYTGGNVNVGTFFAVFNYGLSAWVGGQVGFFTGNGAFLNPGNNMLIAADSGTTIGNYETALTQVKINQVTTNNFAPLQNFKVVSMVSPTGVIQPLNGLSFGSDRIWNRFWNGIALEVIGVSTSLSSAEIIAFENYLNNEYLLF